MSVISHKTLTSMGRCVVWILPRAIYLVEYKHENMKNQTGSSSQQSKLYGSIKNTLTHNPASLSSALNTKNPLRSKGIKYSEDTRFVLNTHVSVVVSRRKSMTALSTNIARSQRYMVSKSTAPEIFTGASQVRWALTRTYFVDNCEWDQGQSVWGGENASTAPCRTLPGSVDFMLKLELLPGGTIPTW